jgi:hypothetical protein
VYFHQGGHLIAVDGPTPTPHAHSQCYGVVVDEEVRCYAWTSSEAVRVVPETNVRMPPAAAYVYKAVTDAAYLRRGLLYRVLAGNRAGCRT